jgi:hypothetical protein
VRHAAPVVFPVDFDNGEHVYRVHHINVQLVTDPVIMPSELRPVVGPILKQHHRTASLALFRARRRWRLHTWPLILFSDEPRFSLRFSEGRYCMYRRRGNSLTRYSDVC